jgi:hypothetical protein
VSFSTGTFLREWPVVKPADLAICLAGGSQASSDTVDSKSHFERCFYVLKRPFAL